MKRTYALIIAVTLLAPGARSFAQGAANAEARRAAATRLTTGKWGGTVSPPNGGTEAIEFEVTTTADSASVVLVGNGSRFVASNVRFESGALRFTWSPGPSVDCKLAPQPDGGFSGECDDGSGGVGKLVMTPPKKS